MDALLILHKNNDIIYIENKEKEMMQMLRERITNSEKEMISIHIKDCVNRSERCSTDHASIDHILRVWADAKSEYLTNLFPEDKLIVSEPISFFESIDNIEDKITQAWHDNPDTYIAYFYKEITNIFRAEDYDLFWAIRDIFTTETLATNHVKCRNSFKIPLPEGKFLKVENGTKTMKLLRSIVKAYDLDMVKFEHFQNFISTCTQVKKLEGELCFSIHPLDYMTMSDNESDWSSCMSWRDNGEYRHGTVEMMNSPCVVVGYLRSAHDMYMGDGLYWNNKKWRCLFIVDPNFIISVKSYPYYNESLTKLAVGKLRELFGWGSEGSIVQYFPKHYGEAQEIDGRQVRLHFYANLMYNDFGSTDHFITINPNADCDLDCSYQYSGPSECMWCGSTNEIPYSSSLCCDDCGSFTRCANCGEVVEGDYAYWGQDGNCYCEDCWSSIYDWDEINQCDEYVDNLDEVYLSTSNEKFELDHNKVTRFYSLMTNLNGNGWSDHFNGKAHYHKEQGVYFVYPNQVTEHTLDNHFCVSYANRSYFIPLLKENA